jgi:hypothetical protein
LGVPRLEVQAVWYGEDLVIVYNRPQDEHLDYTQLISKTITKLHDLGVKLPQSVTFYARKIGEEEPDWQKTVNIKPKEQPYKDKPPSTASSSTSAVVTEQVQQDTPINSSSSVSPPRQLSDFCFTRNKGLLKADLPSPDPKVAENVRFFHQLDEKTKLELAPILEDFFKNPDKTSLSDVPFELRQWFEDLKSLKDAEFKSQAVWLSRYCHDCEKTMTTINDLFAILEKREQQKQIAPEPASQAEQEEPEIVSQPLRTKSQPRQGMVSRSSAHRQSTSQPSSMGSQKFTPDELGYMIVGSLLIATVGWFLWGTANALGVVGWIAAIASVGSGVGGVVGNEGLRVISGIVLLVIFLIFFFVPFVGLIILWIEFLGWLIGLVWGGAIKMIAKSSGALSLTSPKPMRLSVVFFVVVLIGMAYAARTPTEVAKEVAPTGTSVDRVKVVITDTAITMSNRSLRTAFALEVENKASKDCELSIELATSGGFSVTYDSSPRVMKGEKKTINFRLSNGGLFQLECEGSLFERDLLDLTGPEFTVRDK